jgi:hypothetical protein
MQNKCHEIYLLFISILKHTELNLPLESHQKTTSAALVWRTSHPHSLYQGSRAAHDCGATRLCLLYAGQK